MAITNLLRLINVLIAILAIPPSVGLLLHVVGERKLIPTTRNSTNQILRFMFAVFSVIGIFNGLLSFLLLVGFDFDLLNGWAQAVFNFRNIIVNLAVFVISWGFWIVTNRTKGK